MNGPIVRHLEAAQERIKFAHSKLTSLMRKGGGQDRVTIHPHRGIQGDTSEESQKNLPLAQSLERG